MANKRRVGRPSKGQTIPPVATNDEAEQVEEIILDEGHAAPSDPSPLIASLADLPVAQEEPLQEQEEEEEQEEELHLDPAALLVEESGDSAAAWLQTSATQALDLAAHSVLCYELLGGEGVERAPDETDAALGSRLWAEWEESTL